MAEFRMPSLGADMTAGILIAWKKQPGDRVKRGEIIAEVETDKADVDVECHLDGVLEKILVQPGEKVPVGTPLALIRTEGEPVGAAREISPPRGATAPAEPVSPAPTPPPQVTPAPALTPSQRRALRERTMHPPQAPPLPKPPPLEEPKREIKMEMETAPLPETSRVRVSPLASRKAAELGVQLAGIRGTGFQGSITAADVEQAAAKGGPAPSLASIQATGTEDKQARMRRAIASAMARSKREIPHYYLSHTIDLETALQWLAAENEKRPIEGRILYGTLLIKAVALALRKVPDLNAWWDGVRGVRKEGIHVGVAISLRGGGLVAPAIHETDKLSLSLLMERLADVTKRARAGSLRSSEMSEPTITVTSLGETGVERVFGIIFPPQVAIVGFGKIAEMPLVVEGKIVPKRTITATLSGDHRVTDGHQGAAFLVQLDKLLQQPEKLQ